MKRIRSNYWSACGFKAKNIKINDNDDESTDEEGQ